MSLLRVEALEARHGLLKAVRAVSFDCGEGDIVALVGANGAGKTTLLRSIAGVHPISGGRVVFDGQDISQLRAPKRVRMGIAMVPEGRHLFCGMSVEDNLRVAGMRARQGPWKLDTVLDAFPQLRPKLKAAAGTLSGGQQQAVSIARALMTNPRVLLLDEISLGLSPIAVDQVYESLQGLIRAGTTIVLVEQDLTRALAVSRTVICMLEGGIPLQGRCDDVTRAQITDAYFGLGRNHIHADA
jgi:branched-chain amino acid transport system ATP-binding protein